MINVLIFAVVAWIIIAVIIFPLLVMTMFAMSVLWPYLLGAAVLYYVWKYIRGR